MLWQRYDGVFHHFPPDYDSSRDALSSRKYQDGGGEGCWMDIVFRRPLEFAYSCLHWGKIVGVVSDHYRKKSLQKFKALKEAYNFYFYFGISKCLSMLWSMVNINLFQSLFLVLFFQRNVSWRLCWSTENVSSTKKEITSYEKKTLDLLVAFGI